MNQITKVIPTSGFPEWLPEKRLVEERFISIIRDQFQLYGFTPIETPAVERLEILSAKGGIGRQIYSLQRPAVDNSDTGLGLHFDLTVPLARYVVQHSEKLSFPFRRYQIQKVWRGERAQRGRFREFYQCDIDVVGRNSLDQIHDAEIPCVINSVFSALGIPDFCVQISNRKVLADILSSHDADAEQLARIMRAIDKSLNANPEETHAALIDEGVNESLVPAILNLLNCQSIEEANQVFTDCGAPTDGLKELAAVIDNAESLGLPKNRIRPNFRIARGLDYYTGTVYETFVTGFESWGSVCSGGRYDDLASYFTNQKFPGVGISIGLSRLLELVESCEIVKFDAKVPTQVLITTLDRDNFMPQYLSLAGRLREKGIRTEVYLEPKSLRNQITYANTNGIPFAIIAGETEFADGEVQIKNLTERTQHNVAINDVANAILEQQIVANQ